MCNYLRVISIPKGWILLCALTLTALTCTAYAPPGDTTKKHIERLTDSAHVFNGKGDKKSALDYHKRALEFSKKGNLQEHQARSLLNIAKILKTEDADKSLEHLSDALGIAKKIAHKVLESDIYLAMSEIYRQEENYAEALYALEEHHHLVDSLLARNTMQEITRTKAADRASAERSLLLTILGAVVLIALVLAVYFRKTKKLNAELQESNLVKDKLFSILAHDLRGPAGSIAQSLELMGTDFFPPEDEQAMKVMLIKQSKAFSETLNTLLEWANGHLQGIVSQPVEFDAKVIISKNREMLSAQAANKQLQIVDNTPGPLLVFADAHHFDIILRNLLSNAVKFSHPGGTITIGTEEKKDVFAFFVRDEGIGISAVRQKQLDTAGIDVSFGTKGEKGTGLGLLLAKEFAKALGGGIWLTSEEGRGTTFYFSVRKAGREINV